MVPTRVLEMLSTYAFLHWYLRRTLTYILLNKQCTSIKLKVVVLFIFIILFVVVLLSCRKLYVTVINLILPLPGKD